MWIQVNPEMSRCGMFEITMKPEYKATVRIFQEQVGSQLCTKIGQPSGGLRKITPKWIGWINSLRVLPAASPE
jgi:hypothetical protein